MAEPPKFQLTQAGLTGPGMMLLSAAIFGYFGFGMTWIHTSAITGQFLLFVALLDWTLKVTAIAFAVSGILTMLHARAGNMLYSIAGLLSAILFVVVAMLDMADKQHTAISPIILLIFAAWNGYGAWQGLRMLLASPRAEAMI
jgi:hypothetical protein